MDRIARELLARLHRPRRAAQTQLPTRCEQHGVPDGLSVSVLVKAVVWRLLRSNK